MSVVLRDIPPGYNWGWFSREDPRMHLQTVDSKHRIKSGHKVWLEDRGRRCLEPVGKVPAKVLKSLTQDLTPDRAHVEAQWASFMIDNGWIGMTVAMPFVILTAYPHTPNRFTRTIDLREHMAEFRLAETKPEDISLNSELAAVELWPDRPESRRLHIRLEPILWEG